MTPWVLTRPSQFRPAPPPALGSAEYGRGLNETRMWGGAIGSCDNRTTPMWRGSGAATAPYIGTAIANQLAAARHRTLVENAHLFAVMQHRAGGFSIAAWDAKYRYVLLASGHRDSFSDDDGNASTDPDPSGRPSSTTSAHPEYPSAIQLWLALPRPSRCDVRRLCCVRRKLGNHAGTLRSFFGFSSAIEEMANARVYGGMHFRTAVRARQRPWRRGRPVRAATRDASAARRLGDGRDDESAIRPKRIAREMGRTGWIAGALVFGVRTGWTERQLNRLNQSPFAW